MIAERGLPLCNSSSCPGCLASPQRAQWRHSPASACSIARVHLQTARLFPSQPTARVLLCLEVCAGKLVGEKRVLSSPAPEEGRRNWTQAVSHALSLALLLVPQTGQDFQPQTKRIALSITLRKNCSSAPVPGRRRLLLPASGPQFVCSGKQVSSPSRAPWSCQVSSSLPLLSSGDRSE